MILFLASKSSKSDLLKSFNASTEGDSDDFVTRLDLAMPLLWEVVVTF